MRQIEIAEGAEVSPEFATVLDAGAVDFIAELAERFASRVPQLLAAREQRQLRTDAGETPDFLAETRAVRESAWHVAPIPADLQDRRVEITGPAERKMIINALNSGARVFMADFEDSMAPTWDNVDPRPDQSARCRAPHASISRAPRARRTG